MIKAIVVLCAITAITCGCSHVHPVNPVTSGTDLDELNRAVRSKRVSVDLGVSARHPFGATFVVEGVRVAADTTLLTLLLEPSDITALFGNPQYSSRRDTVFVTSEINRVIASSKLRGTIDGVVLGLGFGAVAGALLGWVNGDSWFGPAEYALGVGILGGGIGAVTGAVLGSNEIYEFEHR